MTNPLVELLNDAKSLVAKIEAHMGRIEQAKTDAMQFLRPPTPEEQAAIEAATTAQPAIVHDGEHVLGADAVKAVDPSAPTA